MVSPLDRRRHARYPFERDLEIWAADDVDHMIVRAHDISESGFSFVTHRRLKIGLEIVLGLRDNGDHPVRARVRHVRSEGDEFVIGAERLGHA